MDKVREERERAETMRERYRGIERKGERERERERERTRTREREREREKRNAYIRI